MRHICIDNTASPLDYQDLDYRDPRNTGIDKTFQVPRLPGFFTNNNSSQYHDPDNQGLGNFFFDYQELFLDLVIPITKDLMYTLLMSCHILYTTSSSN